MNIKEIKEKAALLIRKQKESTWFQQVKEFQQQYPRGTRLLAIGFAVMCVIGICSLCESSKTEYYSIPDSYSYNHGNAGINSTYNKPYKYNTYNTGYSTPSYTYPSIPGNNLHDIARREAARQQREIYNSINEMAAQQVRETELRIMQKRIADGYYSPKL